MFAHKANNLGLVTRTHIKVEGRDKVTELSSDIHLHAVAGVSPISHMHNINDLK